MIDSATLLTYVAIVLGFVFIPGPATLLTVARASTSGTKVGIATGAGIAAGDLAGDLIHTLMAVAGISAVIATSAVLFTIVKYAGAAYLVYLGIRAIFAGAPTGEARGMAAVSTNQAFQQAIVAEVLTALFFLAFLPQFVNPAHGSVALQLTILGALFVLLGLCSTAVFALTAGRLGRVISRSQTVLKWQGKVVGGLYCALGVRLAMQER